MGALALLVGCGGASPRTASPVSAPPAPQAEAAGPSDLTPNTLRDRRAEPGVRAAPRPLAIGKATAAKCGRLSKVARDAEPVDLLGGRLRIRPPPSSKVPAPLPGAPPIEEESRVITEGGGVSLAIVARETYQLDPDLYEPEADAPTRPGSLDVEAPKFLRATFPSEERLDVVPVAIGAGDAKVRAYAARPPRPNAPPGKDTALVLALLVADDDGPLASVGFYVRGEMVRNAVGSDLVGCTRFAERVASTILPGPRKLERAAGTRTVAELSNGEELAITVPADYVAIPSKGGSRLVKLRPLSLYAGSITVSIADGDVTLPEGTDATVAGKLLGRPTDWRGNKAEAGGFLFAVAPIEEGSGAKRAVVLVKATRQAKALDEMRAVAETLTLRERRAR